MLREKNEAWKNKVARNKENEKEPFVLKYCRQSKCCFS